MEPPPADPHTPSPAPAGRRSGVLLDALRAAAGGGEHRLFKSGKLAGLFPARAGTAAEVALDALADGLLETVRTDLRGKLLTEWVRLTPKGVRHLHATDSPQAAARELRAAVADARTGVTAGLLDARRELAALGERFDQQAADLLARLDALAARLDAALRRADLPHAGGGVAWADAGLRYLDCRPGEPCPLAELFRAVAADHPALTLADFHAGVLKLADARALRLVPDAPPGDPEFAVLAGRAACHAVTR